MVVLIDITLVLISSFVKFIRVEDAETGVLLLMKRMLIDTTQPEETRVVIVNGNRLEDVEFETSHCKQVKGNVYLAKVMRVEPSLQACFVDYGGNRHGFLAFGEIHPDYYNVSDKVMASVDKEVDDIIESKKQSIKDRELEREKQRLEKMLAHQEAERKKLLQKEAALAAKEASADFENVLADPIDVADADVAVVDGAEVVATEENAEVESSENEAVKKPYKKRVYKKRVRRKKDDSEISGELKVSTDTTGLNEETISEDAQNTNDDAVDAEDEDYDVDFEVQKKLLKARKLYHRNSIQDVLKEGQILLVQVVKEERGNKGAALTTYLSLAGRYCVLMPNRIKSGGVSRKITNAQDRNRLKTIVKELPLTPEMSMIVRTAGEEKTKAEIVRDYNYLIRSWNLIRNGALNSSAPALVHEEGNLIKRALRDIYTKEITEIIVDGEDGYKMAKAFFKILSPHNLKKIKFYKKFDMPLFQRFQVETQLDRLHESTAQLESGGYLVINPTEALVAIDVNSGRATKEKDLEETAVKTNLEACDEVARQLRMRNLAGLVVVDFIDMEEASNNHAVEKRMKEALKKDRSRIQVGKMSCFGLLEMSRQRLNSSFFENNYQVCAHCQGKGLVRTIESSAVFVLRGIEEEGIKNRSAKVNVFVSSDIAIYLLNQKRKSLIDLETRYNLNIIISADDSIKNISDYKIERTKIIKIEEAVVVPEAVAVVVAQTVAVVDNTPKNVVEPVAPVVDADKAPVAVTEPKTDAEGQDNNYRNRNRRDNRRNRNKNKNPRERFENSENKESSDVPENKNNNAPLQDSVIDTKSNLSEDKPVKEKAAWWKKIIKG